MFINTKFHFDSGEPSKNELYDMVKESGLEDLYEKFHKHGITVEILWDLSDEILKEDLNLTRIQILRYEKSKETQKQKQ